MGGYGAAPQQMAPCGARAAPYGGAPGGALPPGWDQANDPASGKTYYFNRATGETKWEPPVAVAPMAVAPLAAAPAPGQLPPGWDQATDPTSNKTYYFNRATNETKWEPPTAAPVAQMQ